MAAKVYDTRPRGEAYKRRKILESLERAYELSYHLPPADVHQKLCDTLQEAYRAAVEARRYYGELGS